MTKTHRSGWALLEMLEISKGFVYTSFAVTMLTTVVLMAKRYFVWLGSSPAAMANLNDSLALGLLWSLVISAWWASHLRLRGLLEREQSQPRYLAASYVRPGLLFFANLAAIGASAFLTGVLNLLFRADTAPSATWLLPAVAASLLLPLTGYLVGRYLPWPPLALLLAPIGWGLIGYAVRSDATSGLVLLQATASPYYKYSSWFVLAQTGLFLGLVLLLAQRRAHPRPTKLLVPGLALVLVLPCGYLLITRSAPDRQYKDASATASICTVIEREVQFCSSRAESFIRPTFESWSRDIVAATSDFSPSLRFILTDGAALDRSTDGGVSDPAVQVLTPFRGFEIATQPNRADTVAPVVARLVNPEACDLLGADGRVTPMGVVVASALERAELGAPAELLGAREDEAKLVGDALDQPASQRSQWISANRAKIQSCR